VLSLREQFSKEYIDEVTSSVGDRGRITGINTGTNTPTGGSQSLQNSDCEDDAGCDGTGGDGTGGDGTGGDGTGVGDSSERTGGDGTGGDGTGGECTGKSEVDVKEVVEESDEVVDQHRSRSVDGQKKKYVDRN